MLTRATGLPSRMRTRFSGRSSLLVVEPREDLVLHRATRQGVWDQRPHQQARDAGAAVGEVEDVRLWASQIFHSEGELYLEGFAQLSPRPSKPG